MVVDNDTASFRWRMAHSFDGLIPPASNSRAPTTFSESFQPEGSATTTNFVLTQGKLRFIAHSLHPRGNRDHLEAQSGRREEKYWGGSDQAAPSVADLFQLLTDAGVPEIVI